MTLLRCIPVLLVLGSRCHAQELPLNTRQQLENMAAATDEAPDESLLVQLDHWLRRPLDLNKASAEDLGQFPFLSAHHIAQLVRYRLMVGPIIDIHELQAVPGWDPATIRLIQPFVTLGAVRGNGSAGADKHMLVVRAGRTLQRAQGFSRNDGFAGDPGHLKMRYLYHGKSGRQVGVTAEKDPGEPLLRRSMPDFISAHVLIRRQGTLRTLALGDFAVNLGQGLVHWQGLAPGKSPEALAIKRQSAVLRPYTASGEFHFLRGAGLGLARRNWEASLFAARQRVHAYTGLNEGMPAISSFSPSGLHRTAAEYARRHAVGQWVLGGSLQHRGKKGEVGIHAVHHRFDLPIRKRAAPYNRYAPDGNRFVNTGFHYAFTHRNMHLFGEAALDYRLRPAAVQGLLLSAHPALDFALLARWLHRGYTALSANAFTEGSTTGNEQGLYLGMHWRPQRVVAVQAYADLYRFPWLRFRLDAPGWGTDYLVQVQYRPSRHSEAYLMVRSEQKSANEVDYNQPFRVVGQQQRVALRMHWSTTLSPQWQLRSRAEWVQVQRPAGGVSTGFMAFADLRYRSAAKTGADFRLGLFETDDYDSRIYAFEYDVPFTFSIPALYGKGMRSYIALRWQLLPAVALWTRVAHTYFPDQETIGSGLATIEGRHRTDLRVQLVSRF